MKKTEKDFVAWIKKQIDYYKPILGLDIIDVNVVPINNNNYMETVCSYPYIDSEIRYSSRAFENWKTGILKKDRILHELCHLITDPLYCVGLDRFSTKDQIENERERLVDTISAIIRRIDK